MDPIKVEFVLAPIDELNNNTITTNLNHQPRPLSPKSLNHNHIGPLSPANVKLVVEGGGKIARDSLIHKTDVFQFDDVESVQTNELFYRHSSIDSEDTCRSSPLLAASPPEETKKTSKTYLMPFLRSSNSSSLKKKNKQQQSEKLLSSSGSKLKKSVTTNAIENPSQGGSSSLQRSGTFIKHFSSLRRLLSKHASADPLPANHKTSVSSIPTNSKQLTISVKPPVEMDAMNNGSLDVVSIPLKQQSNNSFTITNAADSAQPKKKKFHLRLSRKGH